MSVELFVVRPSLLAVPPCLALTGAVEEDAIARRHSIHLGCSEGTVGKKEDGVLDVQQVYIHGSTPRLSEDL